jgi:hypothetical protein
MFPTVQEEKIVKGDKDIKDIDNSNKSNMEIDSISVKAMLQKAKK